MEKGKDTYKLPEGWAINTLGEIAFVNMGQSPPSNSYNIQKNGLPFYQGKSEFGEMYPTVKKYCSAPIKIVENDDVLISVRAPIGPTNLVKEKSCIGRGLAGIKPFAGMSGKFLLYQLRTLEKMLQEKGTGTTFKSISKKTLEDTQLRVPPLLEQQRIVSKIESLFSELEHAEKGLIQAKQKLDIYRQAFLKSVFKGTLSSKYRNRAPLADKNTKHDLPKTWKYKTIGSMAAFTGSGSTPKGGRNTYLKEGIPFIRSQNVLVNQLQIDDLVFISSDIHDKMKRTKTKPGDILLNITGASIGRCAFIPDGFAEGNVNQHVCIIRIDHNIINYKYLTYFLNSPEIQQEINRINTGATREALTLSQVRNLRIPICDIQEQKVIVQELESKLTLSDNLAISIDKSIEELQSLKYSILKKAFEGKLISQDSSDEPAQSLLATIKKEKIEYLKLQKKALLQKPKRIQSMEKDKTVWQILSSNKIAMRSDKVWTESKHKDDIDAFYAEVKELISLGKIVEDKRQGKVSYLKIK